MADIRSARRGRRSENNYLRAFLLGLGLAFIIKESITYPRKR